MADPVQNPDTPTHNTLAAIEDTAVDLARTAARMMRGSEFGTVTVTYKTQGPSGSVADPVSQLDQEIEARIRATVAERFPGHEIIGEEVERHPDRPADFIWVVDPIDGTTNFVNGFPIYACSIGVLYRGLPVVGVIWCSTAHTLSPGTYHARRGNPLCFEGEPLPEGSRSQGLRRSLVTLPSSPVGRDPNLDVRVSGSAAAECAYVAAGIVAAARFKGLNIWDVTAGLALAEAAGHDIWERRGRYWRRFHGFAVTEDPIESARRLRGWKGEIVMGRADVVERLRAPKWRKAVDAVRNRNAAD